MPKETNRSTNGIDKKIQEKLQTTQNYFRDLCMKYADARGFYTFVGGSVPYHDYQALHLYQGEHGTWLQGFLFGHSNAMKNIYGEALIGIDRTAFSQLLEALDQLKKETEEEPKEDKGLAAWCDGVSYCYGRTAQAVQNLENVYDEILKQAERKWRKG